MRKSLFLLLAMLFVPAVAHATTADQWGSLSLSAGVGEASTPHQGKAVLITIIYLPVGLMR